MKAKIFHGSIFLFLSFALLCCKKDDPKISPPIKAVFYFNGKINGSPVDIEADGNNYYMYSSYRLDGNGVYDFIGELKNYGCVSNCTNSLKIYIKDYRPYSVAPTNIDSSLSPGYYSFNVPSGAATKFAVQFFDSLYTQAGQSYAWSFGDGTTSNLNRPVHQFNRPGFYTIALNAQSASSCSSSLTNTITVGQVGDPLIAICGGSASGNTYTFGQSEGGGTPPYSYYWDFGDGNSSRLLSPVHTYTNPGVYAASFSVTDASNTTVVWHQNIATQTTTICNTNFYPLNSTPIANPLNLCSVMIEWHDANGNLYMSSNNSQSTKSMFNVTSVADYKNNSNGQPTKIVHAQVICTLYNGTSSVLLTGEVSFAIAHL
jgi:PKD repeat protein